MKKLLLVVFVFFLFSADNYGQLKYAAPKGYIRYEQDENKPYALEKDLDNDGINDHIIIYSGKNSGKENIVAFYLSTVMLEKDSYYYFPFNPNNYDVDFKNNILKIEGCFGTGRHCRSLKFKYYPELKDMRLIGYDEESFGNVVHDGAYVKTVNLLTNKYELSGKAFKTKISKAISLPVLTLENIDEQHLSYLAELGSAYLK